MEEIETIVISEKEYRELRRAYVIQKAVDEITKAHILYLTQGKQGGYHSNKKGNR